MFVIELATRVLNVAATCLYVSLSSTESGATTVVMPTVFQPVSDEESSIVAIISSIE